MYKFQKGILPSTLRIVGIAMIFYSMLLLLIFSVKLILMGTLGLPSDSDQRVLIFIPAIPLYLFGCWLINIFPAVRLSQEGLRYRGWLLSSVVRWDEIDNLVETRNKIILLLIKREGLHFFDGLLFEHLTAVILHREYPVILLSPSLEQRDQILEEIMTHSLAKKIRNVNDPYS